MSENHIFEKIKVDTHIKEVFSEGLPWYLSAIPPFLKASSAAFPTSTARLLFYLGTIPRLRAKHRANDKMLEGFTSKGYFQGPKAKMAWKKWGSSGDVVLLLHGWESRGTALRSFIRPLLASGHQVIALDFPAHGDSTGFQTNLLDAGEHLYQFMLHVQPQKIIAHSFGSAVTTYACSRGNTPFLKKVVMVAVPVSTLHIFQNVLETLSLPTSLLSFFDKHVEKKYGISLEAMDLRQLFAHTSIPSTLIVHDERDAVVPYQAAWELAAKYEQILLQPTEGLGHFRLLRNQQVIRAIMNYLCSRT